MSTDLDLFQDMAKIKLPKQLKIQSNSSENDIIIQEEEENNSNDNKKKNRDGGDEKEEECSTPTSEESKIPTFLSCPPAPKKPKTRAAVSCKRKLSTEFQFFEIANRDEVDSFFKAAFDDISLSKRRCPCT